VPAGPRTARRRRAVRLLAAVVLLALAVPAVPQDETSDEPILASAISEQNIELRGRYVRQWKQEDGTLVLLVNGGFRLDMGQRRLSASNAVVWIASGRGAKDGRKSYDLVVYLSENAEVREPAGTETTDNVLLVRGLRTFGQIIKYQDAHAPENMEQSPLYQQALRDRQRIESGAAPPTPGAPEAVTTQPAGPEAVRPPPEAERRPRIIRYRLPNIEPAQTPTGERVFVATGGVYFSQDGGPEAPMLEIRADNAVVFPAADSATALFGTELQGEQRGPQPAEGRQPPESQGTTQPAPRRTKPQPARGQKPAVLGPEAGGAAGRVRAVYLEGDVVLSLGERFVRAHRLYYDFEQDRALILDAVFRADIPERGIPLYVRADEIRQLSAREFTAERAVVTTSEFYTPSYHIGADKVYIRDQTPRDAQGRPTTTGLLGTYEMQNTTLNVEGVPLLWWPYSQGLLDTSETLIRRLNMGYSSNRGFEFESGWYLFNLLGVKPQPGFDPTLRLDYYSKRGPGVGVNVDYQRDDYHGLFRSYYLHDDGQDKLGPLRRAEEEPDSTERGRILWRHRHYLPDNWEATLELAYVSDPHYLEEFEKAEYQEGKEQETAFYLKRARDTEAITLLANYRLLDFLTQTEHLPELTYRRIGDTFLDPVVLYHESRIGAVRYLPAELESRDLLYRLYQEKYQPGPIFTRNYRATDVTARADVRQEAEWPLKIGALNLVPFASVRGSYWDGQPRDEGALWRGLGVLGVRGGTSFSRVYDGVHSDLLAIDRIRHIIQPDFAAWWSDSNTRSELLTPFDYGIETIDDFYGMRLGVRQTWQTKRGTAERQRTVDLLTLNLEAGFFGNTDGRHDISNGWADPLRPENSRTRNYFAGDVSYRLSDTTSLLYDFNFDLNDGSFDRQDVALAVERSPRLSYVFGTRYAGDVQMNFVGGGWNYKLTEKHITAVRAWYDIETGKVGEVTLSYVRKLPRWYVGLNFGYSNLDNNFTTSLSVWPEGIPEWTLGSRRFSSLSTSTGIRP